MTNDKDYYVKIGRDLADKVKSIAKQEKRTVKGETETLIELGLQTWQRQQEKQQ